MIGTADPAVVCVPLVNSAAETNVGVKVPWNNCKFVYAYTAVTLVIDNTADLEIDLEIGATEVATITITKNNATGTIDEATLTNTTAADNLRKNLNVNSIINVEIDGSSTGTGAFMLYLYFEPM
jgi:hypothetical protein